jgi:hypothetical protein
MTAYAINPGQTIQIPLNQGLNTIALEVWNGTPFDLDYQGFGTNADVTVVAGTGQTFYAFDPVTKAQNINTGKITITANNNNNVNGTGVINVVIYKQGDQIPGGRVFPVAIPTQVVSANVSTVQTLSNEGGTTGLLVIDIGPLGNNQMLQVYNDHFLWSVVQSGVAHQVLKGNTSGNPLFIGQNGDTSEVLGSLLIDQNETVTGTAVWNNGVAGKTVNVTAAGNLTAGVANPPGAAANNNLVANGDVIANLFFRVLDNSGNARAFATNLSTPNSTALLASINDSKLHIYDHLGTTELANFAESNPLLHILGQLLIDGVATAGPSNGSIAGTVAAYEFTIGSFKIVLLDENGFNTASNVNLTLPTAFTKGALIWAGGVGASGGSGGFICLLSGTPRSIIPITGFAAGGGTTAASQNGIFQYSFSEQLNSFDTIQFVPTNSAHTARALIVGV